MGWTAISAVLGFLGKIIGWILDHRSSTNGIECKIKKLKEEQETVRHQIQAAVADPHSVWNSVARLQKRFDTIAEQLRDLYRQLPKDHPLRPK